jgi:hypothetical protein
MGWKVKEKPLTAEEAIEQARKQLAPYWNRSKPLLAAVESQGKVSAHPLDQVFLEKSWLMIFVDPYDPEGELCLDYFRRWYDRYHGHTLDFMLFICPKFEALRNPEVVKAMAAENFQCEFPMILDHNGLMARAFGEEGLPKTLLFQKGKRVFVGAGRDWLDGLELPVQKFLRESDPGLPLETPLEMRADAIRTVERIFLGTKPVEGVPFVFSSPGFEGVPLTEKGTRRVKFSGKLVDQLAPGEYVCTGDWTQDRDCIVTEDNTAAIQFYSKGTHVSVVLQTIGKIRDIPRIVVEVNGRPVLDDFFTSSIFTDEEGHTYFKVEQNLLYSILQDLRAETRTITLRFINAHLTAIALYSIIICERRERESLDLE